jgi:hypothetical protein
METTSFRALCDVNSDNNNGEPIDMRDDQLLSQVLLRANNVDDIETLPQSSVERIMQLQMKQNRIKCRAR